VILSGQRYASGSRTSGPVASTVNEGNGYGTFRIFRVYERNKVSIFQFDHGGEYGGV
jgi:hypothetical protein